MKNILLIEPNYKNKYPPLGLMKISAYHKEKNDYVKFIKGKKLFDNENKWDRIYITTLFTFEWEKTIEAIEYAKTLISNTENIFVGGITATLMPNKIKNETGIKPIKRRLDASNIEAKKRIGYDDQHIIDNYTPDYHILDDIDYDYPYQDAYFAFMTRGCGMNCDFCAVDTLEPEYEPYISIKKQIKDIDKKYGEKQDLLLMDNNVLISPKFDKIIEEVIDLGYGKEKLYSKEESNKTRDGIVDFNQGLDANILARNEKRAKLLGKLKIKPARIAFDHISDKSAYKEAIKNCSKYGIKYFSNYMLYNADFVNAKGDNYKADEPEDLYKRIRITMDLQKEVNENKSKNNEIRIYSFPMKYIPLKDKDRSYIGTKWNKKFLRAIQVMLLPAHGIGGVSEEFFRKAFGENLNEFRENIRMPESILMSRGKFLKKDSENIEEWEQRIKQNKEVFKKYKIYKDWKYLYKEIQGKKIEDEFLEIIKDNSFNHKKYFKINNVIIKEIYLYYLSNSQLLILLDKVINKNNKNDIKIIRDFFNKFSGYYYNLIINYIYKKRISNKKLVGFLKLFNKKALTDILTKWVEEDFENDHVLPRVNKALNSIDKLNINLNYFRAIKRFIDSGCLNEDEVNKSKYHIKNINEEEIIDILKNNIHDFSHNLKLKNQDLTYYENIEKKIEVITTELGERLSLF